MKITERVSNNWTYFVKKMHEKFNKTIMLIALLA